jgi:hypothetical protein
MSPTSPLRHSGAFGTVGDDLMPTQFLIFPLFFAVFADLGTVALPLLKEIPNGSKRNITKEFIWQKF